MGMGRAGRALRSVSLGSLAAEMARLAAPFGMRHLARDAADAPAPARELGVGLVELNQVIRQGDVVTVNGPLLPSTSRPVDARRIALVKRTTCRINTARGRIAGAHAG